MITLYNTLSRTKETLTPVVPGEVSIYVCGVTPYDKAHIGHARPAVVWDVFKRHLIRRGYVVKHVQNFTDIDDKLVRRAQELNIPMDVLAERHMDDYLDALTRLDVLFPDFFPRVTDNIGSITAFILRLIEKGYAYESAGDVYFAVKRSRDYGKLSRRSTDELLAGARIPPHEAKRDPEDFALWKRTEADQPGWPSPWGRGRPGWHIECSVMSSAYLGERFDVHGGGVDLVFPHHENEIAQSEAYYDHPSASIWMHNGLVTRESVKMSKSLGNGADLTELLDRFDPEVVRTFLLSVHYRTPLAFSEEELGNWGRAMGRLRSLYAEVRAAPPPSRLPGADWVADLWNFEHRFLVCLDDDLNTAKAFAELFTMARSVREQLARGGDGAPIAAYLGQQNLLKADRLLRFLSAPGRLADRAADNRNERRLVDAMVQLREAQRGEKNFAVADAIRQALLGANWAVEDTAQGPRVKAIDSEEEKA